MPIASPHSPTLAYSWQVLELYSLRSFKCVTNLQETYQAVLFRVQMLQMKKKKLMRFLQQETWPNPVKYRDLERQPLMRFWQSCSATFHQNPQVWQHTEKAHQVTSSVKLSEVKILQDNLTRICQKWSHLLKKNK